MALKRTQPLAVRPSQHIAEGLFHLHPNDGSDLGLYTKSHPVQWCRDVPTKDFIEGECGPLVEDARLELLNECRHETLEMNMQQWKQAGSPQMVLCLIDGGRFLLNKLPDPPKED